MNSLDLNGSKNPYNLFSWVLEIKWHDGMMTWCNAHDAEMNARTKQNHTTNLGKAWKASEAPVLGRYNTPPLQEDLVPRSRMAPEGSGRAREGVKLSCFFDKEWNQRTLRGWKLERKNTTEINIVENTPLEKRNKDEEIRAALRLKSDMKLDKMKRTWVEGTTLRLNG